MGGPREASLEENGNLVERREAERVSFVFLFSS